MNIFLIILIILVLIIGIAILIPLYKYLKFQQTINKIAINNTRYAIFKNPVLQMPKIGSRIIVKFKNGSIGSGFINHTNIFEADSIHSFQIDSTVVYSWAYCDDLKEIDTKDENIN